MKKKLLIPILAIVLLVGGFEAYSMAFAKKPPKAKITGTIYILPKQFTLNLAGGQYATLTVALLLAPTQSAGVTNASDPPPEGFGSLPEEAVIRAIITNDVTDQKETALITASGRQALEHQILQDIQTKTDTKVDSVYFTDLAVQ